VPGQAAAPPASNDAGAVAGLEMQRHGAA
jgi:hypothetical protein